MDLEEVYLRQIDQKLKQNNELQEEANKLLKAILRELTKNQHVASSEMTDAGIYMIIEASVLLAFVGYMWWRSQPPKKQGHPPVLVTVNLKTFGSIQNSIS